MREYNYNETIGEIKGFINDKTGEPWFLAGKVCDCLKLKNSSESLRKLQEKESTQNKQEKKSTE